MSWTASTDNVGVTGYRIFDGATQVGTSATTSFTVTGLAPSSAHTYTVRAVDVAMNVSAPSNAVPVTTDPPVVANLRVQYRAADTNATDNQMKPHFNIVNAGTTAIPMSELTVRYWYTNDGTQPQVYNCDFASRGCSNISASFVSIPAVTGANTYLQLSFSAGAGSLAAGQQSGEIQNRLNNQNFSAYQRGQRLLVRSNQDGVRRLDQGHALPQRDAGLGDGADALGDQHHSANRADQPGRRQQDQHERLSHVDGFD